MKKSVKIALMMKTKTMMKKGKSRLKEIYSNLKVRGEIFFKEARQEMKE